ncbi:MAG: hypothetical protein DDT24_00936 [Chloroflexi bacterium]|nr:hypothetical protein [Chloroflexota bacterium]
MVKGIPQSTDRVKQGAINKLNTMKEVATRLIPQIMQWMTTGVVAKGKILHTGLTQARAIIRNLVLAKAGISLIPFSLTYPWACGRGAGLSSYLNTLL